MLFQGLENRLHNSTLFSFNTSNTAWEPCMTLSNLFIFKNSHRKPICFAQQAAANLGQWRYDVDHFVAGREFDVNQPRLAAHERFP